MCSDHTGNTAVMDADNSLKAKGSKKYRKGIAICREQGCKRIVDGKCLGWKDPLYMWEKYGECPYFSDDPKLVSEIEAFCRGYQGYMDGKTEMPEITTTVH